MKIELDTRNKTIKFEGTVKIVEVLKIIKNLLPKDWKDFSIESNTVINHWHSPIVVEKYLPPQKYDWYCGGSINENKMLCLNEGTYNIEAKV